MRKSRFDPNAPNVIHQSTEGEGAFRSQDAESGMLSCLLQDPSLLAEARQIITPSDFWNVCDRLIYESLLGMSLACTPIDNVTVSQYLLDRGLLDKIGGPSKLAELLSFVPTKVHFPYYTCILKGKALSRNLWAESDTLRSSLLQIQEGGSELHEAALACAGRIQTLVREASAPKKSWGDRIEDIRRSYEDHMRGISKRHIQTNWKCFNDKLGGIPRGYTLLLGPRKRGKSSAAIHLARISAMKFKKRSDVFTYECSSHDTVLRMVSDMTQISGSILFNPDQFPPDKEQQRAINKALTDLSESPIEVHDGVGRSAHDISAVFQKNDTELGVVDYLLRLPRPPEASPKEGTEGAVRENSRILFDATRDSHDLPVRSVLVLNHTVETGDRAGESRWGAAPENDCDLCLVIQDEGIWVKSRRNGAAEFNLPVRFQPQTYSFREYNPDEP